MVVAKPSVTRAQRPRRENQMGPIKLASAFGPAKSGGAGPRRTNQREEASAPIRKWGWQIYINKTNGIKVAAERRSAVVIEPPKHLLTLL